MATSETGSLPLDLSGGYRPANDGVLPEDVAAYGRRHGLDVHIKTAIDLVKASFSSLEKLEFQLEADPESDGEWVVLRVTVRGEVKDVLDSYRRYCRQWVQSTPWPERNLICISYNIL